MNRNSNTYTVLYAAVMVIVVAAVLAFTALSLREDQANNVKIEKQRQILTSINVVSDAKTAPELYKELIVDSYILDAQGQKVEGDAFDVVISEQVARAESERELPVFVAQVEGQTKYILPMYGAGLWGPIWGYVSLDADGDTIYGAVFAHQGETAGLGAEITKEKFAGQFAGKTLFQNGEFVSVSVVKGTANGNAHEFDAVSGGTITSQGVSKMLKDCIAPYQNFLKSLK